MIFIKNIFQKVICNIRFSLCFADIAQAKVYATEKEFV